jgi:hypothetical protein
VDLPFSTIVDLNESNVTVPKYEIDCFFNNTCLQQQREIRKQNANAKWNALKEEIVDSSSYSISTVTQKSISGVPYYPWRTGCSPTASGMVLGYWDSHGYPNFPSRNYLIDELADAMGTSS